MKRHWAIRIWNEGEYFDLRHLNHFLSGLLLASAGILIDFGFVTSIVISICAMIVWEIFEIVKDVKETVFNRSFDIILGVVAFLLVYLINFSTNQLKILFFVSLIVWIIVEMWGFCAYKLRGENQ